MKHNVKKWEIYSHRRNISWKLWFHRMHEICLKNVCERKFPSSLHFENWKGTIWESIFWYAKKLLLWSSFHYFLLIITGVNSLGLRIGKHLMLRSMGLSAGWSQRKFSMKCLAKYFSTCIIKFSPMHRWDPAPNPSNLSLSSLFPPFHLSGMKSSGLENTLGSRWAKYVA